MKTKQQYEKYIRSVIDEYVPKLFLEKYLFDLKDGCDRQESHFEIDVNYPYLNAEISYSNKSFEDWNKGKPQRDYIVHELCHLLTEPLYVKARKKWVSEGEIENEREHLTDYICNVVLKK